MRDVKVEGSTWIIAVLRNSVLNVKGGHRTGSEMSCMLTRIHLKCRLGFLDPLVVEKLCLHGRGTTNVALSV